MSRLLLGRPHPDASCSPSELLLHLGRRWKFVPGQAGGRRRCHAASGKTFLPRSRANSAFLFGSGCRGAGPLIRWCTSSALSRLSVETAAVAAAATAAGTGLPAPERLSPQPTLPLRQGKGEGKGKA